MISRKVLVATSPICILTTSFLLLLLVSCLTFVAVEGFSIVVPSTTTTTTTLLHSSSLSSCWNNQHQQRSIRTRRTMLYAMKTDEKKENDTTTIQLADEYIDEDAPAGIEGAQFFGGNKEKEEFFDPVIEIQANIEEEEVIKYERFQDRNVFTDNTVAELAQQLQLQINNAIMQSLDGDSSTTSIYSNNVQWETPFPKSNENESNPIIELQKSKNEFYKQLDVAIISGEIISINKYKLSWEISILWPTLWEPRIILSGTSIIETNNENNIITKQIDTLHQENDQLISLIYKQILPKFWDIYHIGMTPAAEIIQPMKIDKPLLRQYQIQYIQSKLILQITLNDTNYTRLDQNANIIPNNAFTTIIKTMGPTKQTYITTSPIEIQIIRNNKEEVFIQWNIPLSTQYKSNPILYLSNDNSNNSNSKYILQPQRKVALIPYNGNGPQDIEIANIRKQLYDSIIKDGYKPKLDNNGRPIFFFIQDSVKACFTNDGLGMAVYEWRPRFTKPNKVGIELE